MSTLRMTSDLRRQLILGAAKRCFARNGFAGTTTKSVAAAAAISAAFGWPASSPSGRLSMIALKPRLAACATSAAVICGETENPVESGLKVKDVLLC